MIRMLPLLLTFLSLSLQAAETMDPLQFFEKVRGNYVILIAGTQVPKEDNKLGYVTVESEEGLIVLPYCHKTGGVCDPGFRSFPTHQTEIIVESYEPNDTQYTLTVTDADGSRKYVWEERNGVIHFLDESYTLASGEAFPLEFIMEKKQPVPPIP